MSLELGAKHTPRSTAWSIQLQGRFELSVLFASHFLNDIVLGSSANANIAIGGTDNSATLPGGTANDLANISGDCGFPLVRDTYVLTQNEVGALQ